MKKLLTLLFLSTLTLTSCSKDGPAGPQGPPGPQGPSGNGATAETAKVLDFNPYNFTADNNYELAVNFNNQNVEVFEDNVILVYLKTGEDGEADGQPVEIWRQLPQTYYVDGKELQYNFDYTFYDVLIFLDGTVDFATLDPSYTDNQVFRIVIVPSEFAQTTKVDLGNMKAVMNALDLKSGDIQKVHLKK